MIDMKVESLVSLEYNWTNLGILVGCYHAIIDLSGSL